MQTYVIVWLTMDLKLPTWPIGFFEKFHLGDFYQPILPYLAARFQKNPLPTFCNTSLYNYGVQ